MKKEHTVKEESGTKSDGNTVKGSHISVQITETEYNVTCRPESLFEKMAELTKPISTEETVEEAFEEWDQYWDHIDQEQAESYQLRAFKAGAAWQASKSGTK